MTYQKITNSNRPKQVVYFHDSHGFGGMEIYLLRLIDNLDNSRYFPSVLVPGYTDEFRSSQPRAIEQFMQAGINLLRPENPGNILGYSSLKDINSIARILREHKTDILHIHTCRSEGGKKVTIAARLAGVAGVIRTEHFPPTVTMRSTTKYLVKPFDLMTDFIVTGSEGDRQEQIKEMKRSSKKIIRSYNSIDHEKYHPSHDVRKAKIKLGLNPELPVIGNVGRLVAQKGHIYLIEATALVIEQYGPVNLLLVGDGELRTDLELVVENLGLEDFVHFYGHRDNVIPYLEATDIAAFPSIFEVFSLAMLEYMAVGKPVIGSDHHSFKEAITNRKNGLIVPMKDSEKLAQALLFLLQDDELRERLGKMGLNNVRENFGIKRLSDDMMNLYDLALEM